MSTDFSWLRRMTARDPDEGHRASTPLELLFDLCFVVAVAQAGTQLHHCLVDGHLPFGLAGYAAVFFAIWWAWVNFTWFASAYDTDDVPYRLLTLVQIAGVLVLAAGVPAAFEGFDFTVMTIGYVIMRVAMISQWLRVSRAHPAGRPAALRYAIGIGVCQVGWLVRLAVPTPWSWLLFGLLAVAELAVPAWAEFRGNNTSWHPGHISERYGCFTLIVLGEVVAAATTAVQSAINDRGPSGALIVLAAGGLLLVFGLWWSYFKHEAAEGLRVSLRGTMIWAYAHYFVFASVAALGAGLQAATDQLGHQSDLSPLTSGFAIAVPVAVYLVMAGFAHGTLAGKKSIGFGWIALGAGAVLACAFLARLSLPAAVMAMAVVVGALVAASLAALRRASGSTQSM